MVHAQQVQGFLVLKKSLCGQHQPQETEVIVFYEGISLDIALQPLIQEKVIQPQKVWLCQACETGYPTHKMAQTCCR